MNNYPLIASVLPDETGPLGRFSIRVQFSERYGDEATFEIVSEADMEGLFPIYVRSRELRSDAQTIVGSYPGLGWDWNCQDGWMKIRN